MSVSVCRQLFVTARAEHGDLDSKLVVVQGDIENERDLGIDDAIVARLVDDVSVVFHLAATVSFNEPLRYSQFPLTLHATDVPDTTRRHTHTHTRLTRPFVWDYPGESVPER